MQGQDLEGDLFKRWREGDARAGDELFARYAHRLIRLADQNLSRKVAGRLDGEDVVQSAFRTFFRRRAEGKFTIDSSKELWRLLVTITLRKAWAQGRRHQAAPRDVGAEAPAGDALLAEALAHDPGPEEIATFLDQIEMLLRNGSSQHGTVLGLLLQDYTVAEIAEQLDVSRQTVYRVRDEFQKRLLQAGSASPGEETPKVV
jgi:RNA polymerase sigma-70 factor (ECF subfamily)